MKDGILNNYARLIVKSGLNIQAGQTLVITAPLEGAAFTRRVAATAYKEGAREVVVNWRDELLAHTRYLLAPDEVFAEFPPWQREFYLFYLRQGAAFLSIAASDPELLSDVDPERVAKARKAGHLALKEYQDRLMSNKNAWSVVAVPNQAWAEKVFPAANGPEAREKLWQAIIRAVRADAADPVAAWEQHIQVLNRRLAFLNAGKFARLHYTNSLGTDLYIELPANHVWQGGADHTPAGVEFIANLPTEEVYTLPAKTGVNGKVVSSRPLNYNGNLIKDFAFTFKAGQIVEVTAAQGREVLRKLIATDEGARYLGEVALVPDDSPISNSGLLFYNTLFDENAACHLAIGQAYPGCLAEGETLTPAGLEQAGANSSLVHVDFMIGTPDLAITGLTAAGTETAVFRNGNFAI